MAAISSDGLEAVEAAVREALDAGAASDEVILNILSRRREPPRPAAIVTLEDMALVQSAAHNVANHPDETQRNQRSERAGNRHAEHRLRVGP